MPETAPQIVNRKSKIVNRPWPYWWPFGLAAIWYALDQFTKYLTETNFAPYGSGKEAEVLGGLLVFRYVKNTGASFGFLPNATWVFTLLAALAAIGVLVWYVWQGTRDWWYQLCVGLIFAGIVGNLSDRLFKDGAVTDMIHIPSLEIFKNFNVADSGISIGVVLYIVVTIVRMVQDNKTKAQPDETESGTPS